MCEYTHFNAQQSCQKFRRLALEIKYLIVATIVGVTSVQYYDDTKVYSVHSHCPSSTSVVVVYSNHCSTKCFVSVKRYVEQVLRTLLNYPFRACAKCFESMSKRTCHMFRHRVNSVWPMTLTPRKSYAYMLQMSTRGIIAVHIL